MISIIGTVIGLLGSFIPKLLELWKVKEDHKHELAILQVQAEMAKQQHLYRMEEVQVEADVASERAVYKQAEQKYTGVKFVDGLLALYQGSVRPTITYLFTIGYFIVKYAQYNVLSTTNTLNMWEIIWRLWNSEDMAAFMTIIGFWFGGRLLKSNIIAFRTPPSSNGTIPQKPKQVILDTRTTTDTNDITGY